MTTQQITPAQLQQNASPLVNVQTQIFTGMAVYLKANTTRTSVTTPTAEANLTIQINEPGQYRCQFSFCFCTQTANGKGGLYLDFAGGTTNTAINGGVGFTCYTEAGTFGSQVTQVPQYGSNWEFAFSTIAASGGIDFLYGDMTFNCNAAGSFIPRYAQDFSSANAVTLVANGTFIILTKIG